MLRSIALVVAVLLSSCGPDGKVPSGRYRGIGQLEGAILTFDVSAKSGSLTLAGSNTSIALTLGQKTITSVCPGNFSSKSAEAYPVTSPDPLVAGSVTIESPGIVGSCGATDPTITLTNLKSMGTPIRFTPSS
jgi:hypothetical protein